MNDSRTAVPEAYAMTRRAFVKVLVFCSVVAMWAVKGAQSIPLAKAGVMPGPRGPFLAGPFHSLSSYEATLLEAVTCIIVPTDQDPGAKEAGVVYAIDRILSQQPELRDRYRLGLRWLDHKARSLFEKDTFLDVAPDGQARIIRLAESERLSTLEKVREWLRFGDVGVGRKFFDLVVPQTLTEFYATPVGRQVVGLLGPPQWGGHPDYGRCG